MSSDFEKWLNSDVDTSIKVREVDAVIRVIEHTFSDYHNESGRLVKFMRDLKKWLERHAHHEICLTNDHVFDAEYDMYREDLESGKKIRIEYPEVSDDDIKRMLYYSGD